MKVFGKNGDDSIRSEGARPPQAAAVAAEASIINSGLKVVGNMESDGDIVIAGAVEGDIKSASLTVGEGATVKGALHVGAATIRGRIEGEIRTRSINIASTGQVSGDIRYETMAIEEGARIEGNVGKFDAGAQRASKPAAAAAPGPQPGAGPQAGAAGGAAAKPAARARA